MWFKEALMVTSGSLVNQFLEMSLKEIMTWVDKHLCRKTFTHVLFGEELEMVYVPNSRHTIRHKW